MDNKETREEPDFIKKTNQELTDQDYDFVFAETARGRLNGVNVMFMGISEQEFEGETFPMIKMDINMSKIIHAKEGDRIQLKDNIAVTVEKIEQATYPKIGKVYFNKAE